MFYKRRNEMQSNSVSLAHTTVTVKEVTAKHTIIELMMNRDCNSRTLVKMTNAQLQTLMAVLGDAAAPLSDFQFTIDKVIAKRKEVNFVNGNPDVKFYECKKALIKLSTLGGVCTIAVTDGEKIYHVDAFELNWLKGKFEELKTIAKDMAFNCI